MFCRIIKVAMYGIPCTWVNAWSNVEISTKITLFISQYKIIWYDSNGHGCYILKYYYSNIWIIHVQSPTNIPKSMWKLIFNVTNVIFIFGSPKRKTTKSRWIMTHVELSKTYVFGTKKLKTKQKLQFIWTYDNMIKFELFKSP
jgi:hypothetical protein